MTLFEQELLGSREFSLIPPTMFAWQTKEKGWYLYAGEYPTGWEKKVKVVNLLVHAKKGFVSWFAKPKLAKKGDDSSKTYSYIVPFEGSLPPIGNIVLEGSPPPFARTRSSRCPIASKSRLTTLRPSADTPPSSRT